ncbi:MAG: hypothetical protein JRE43_12130, partial [Deltaproteobacteria bacterium]|nr:hypothetical protein [Deltaproteobacteria bacterium]
MKTGLLTIFAVLISAVLASGSLYASETSTPNADEAAATADSRVDAEPAAAADPAAESPATDQALADAEES